jgi:hypothetical protein
VQPCACEYKRLTIPSCAAAVYSNVQTVTVHREHRHGRVTPDVQDNCLYRAV